MVKITYPWTPEGNYKSFTPKDYLELRKRQGDKCAVCGYELLPGRYTNALVDHDHKTGKVRGLLCMPCNLNVGNYERGRSRTVPEYQARVVKYLNAPPAAFLYQEVLWC